MKIYLNLLTKKTNSGFTLVELLLASVGMFFVLMAAGYGVFVMARENVAANAAGDIQYNLGRAVDFISEEVKTASAITQGGTAQTGCATPILRLTIPFTTTSGSSVPYTVDYYIQTPNSPWLGQNAIYRCGPSLNADGSPSINANTGAYTPTPNILVDLIANEPLSSAVCPGTINNAGTTGWTQSPSSGQKGFYVCLQNVATGQRKLAEIRASASALNTSTNQLGWIGTNTNSRFYGKATYEIITQALARAN
jgi:Tfp pilus assembly protein PilW